MCFFSKSVFSIVIQYFSRDENQPFTYIGYVANHRNQLQNTSRIIHTLGVDSVDLKQTFCRTIRETYENAETLYFFVSVRDCQSEIPERDPKNHFLRGLSDGFAAMFRTGVGCTFLTAEPRFNTRIVSFYDLFRYLSFDSVRPWYMHMWRWNLWCTREIGFKIRGSGVRDKYE